MKTKEHRKFRNKAYKKSRITLIKETVKTTEITVFPLLLQASLDFLYLHFLFFVDACSCPSSQLFADAETPLNEERVIPDGVNRDSAIIGGVPPPLLMFSL